MDSHPPARAAHVAVVERWFEAWNDGDLEGMLASMDPRIEFRPVMPRGAVIVGHAAFADWRRERTTGPTDLHMAVTGTQALDAARVFVTGEIRISRQDRTGIAFTAIYTVRDDLILSAEQYLSDPQLMKQLGMLTAVMTPDGATIACARCGVVIEAQRPIVMVNVPDEAKFWHQQCFVAAYGDAADDPEEAQA
jgi:ketosteroid isomerase-like protein